MAPWSAIALTLVAATGNNVGKALQKEATRKLPRFAMEAAILQQYVRSRQWLVGLAADLAGALLMIGAFALAPVSLVQPVSSVGLVSLALFSHFYLKESLSGSEWLAVALAGAGTIGLGATSEDAPAGAAVSAVRAVTVIGSFIASLGAFSLLRSARRQHRRRAAVAQPKSGAYVFGLQAGTCFGLSAACCRTGFLLGSRHPVCIPLGLAASVGFTSGGFALQTCGLKDGNSLVVCTAAAVTSMVSGVAVGLLALGERLPTSPAARLARLASWTLISVGVAGLAAGSGGAQQMLGLAVTKLPSRVWGYVPLRLALALRTAARSYTESQLLPVVSIGNGAGPPLLSRNSHRGLKSADGDGYTSSKLRAYSNSPRGGSGSGGGFRSFTASPVAAQQQPHYLHQQPPLQQAHAFAASAGSALAPVPAALPAGHLQRHGPVQRQPSLPAGGHSPLGRPLDGGFVVPTAAVQHHDPSEHQA